jgi:hypothetical protein
MVASLSLIPMEIKLEPIFSETIKGSVSKNGEIYFTGTTGINNPSISTQMLIKKIIMDGFKLRKFLITMEKKMGHVLWWVSTVEVRECYGD